MSSIASRASWGARHRDGVGNRPVGRLERYFHHTVTTHLSASATVAQERAQMRAIEQIGQSRFGAGISYNFIVFPSGRIYQGASVHRIAYHSGPGRNVRGAAICLAGNYETNHMTRQQVEAVAWLIRRGINQRWWTGAGRLIPHRSFSSTACSGRHSIAQIPAIERLAASGGGSTPARPATQEDDMTPTQARQLTAIFNNMPQQSGVKSSEGLLAKITKEARAAAQSNGAQIAALTAAVNTLAQAKGIDPADVRKSIEDALADFELTLKRADQ